MHYNLYTIPASPPHSQSAEPRCLYVLSWVQIYLINSQCRTAWSVLSGEECGHLWLGFLYLIPHSANSNTKQRITCCFDRGNPTLLQLQDKKKKKKKKNLFTATGSGTFQGMSGPDHTVIVSYCQALIADLASLLSALVSSSLGYDSRRYRDLQSTKPYLQQKH